MWYKIHWIYLSNLFDLPFLNIHVPSAVVDHGLKMHRSVNIPVQVRWSLMLLFNLWRGSRLLLDWKFQFVLQQAGGEKDRIREALLKVDLSVSSYDTAWVAMVPSPRVPQFPCFPECIEWILDNQSHDGSWGLPYGDPSLIKDALSSTLACILALRRWNVGEEHIKRGITNNSHNT